MLVNHEISVVGQMLTHCRLWQNVRPFYFPLSVKQWSPRTVLTEDEEERLFDVASRHPEASLAYWVACITNNTSAAGLELRGLRLKNLFLSAEGISEIYVPEDSVKNGHRARERAVERASEICRGRMLSSGRSSWELASPNTTCFRFVNCATNSIPRGPRLVLAAEELG